MPEPKPSQLRAWAKRVGGEQANEMDRGRLSDDVNSVHSSSGVEADQSSSVTPQPATPCRCGHPLSDHSQSNPAHCHHEWCMCDEYVPEGGEQAEDSVASSGSRPDPIASKPARPRPLRTIARLLAERMTHPMVPNMFLEEDLYNALREALGGEQAEGPSADLGAAVSARPSSSEPENEEIQGCACKLKPCPFCGEPEDIHMHNTGTIAPYKVRCHYCWAWGPKAPTAEDAVEFWNIRDKGGPMTNPIDKLAEEIAGKKRVCGKSLHWLEYLQRQIKEAGYDEAQAEQILKWCNKAYWAGRRGKRRG